jgi:hypothetical protein
MLVLVLSWIAACGAPQPAPDAGSPPVISVPALSIHPDVGALPANGLRFTFEWSEAMQLGPHRVVFRDASGVASPGAVPRLAWDRDLRVATVEPAGLRVGERYVLVVDGFTSADGGVAAKVERPFLVGPPDRAAPSAVDVQLPGRPPAGSREALRLVFPEPLDARSLTSFAVLVEGRPWDGTFRLEAGDATVRFVPAQPWTDAPVYLSMSAGIRDLAGLELVHRPAGPVRLP